MVTNIKGSMKAAIGLFFILTDKSVTKTFFPNLSGLKAVLVSSFKYKIFIFSPIFGLSGPLIFSVKKNSSPICDLYLQVTS